MKLNKFTKSVFKCEFNYLKQNGGGGGGGGVFFFWGGVTPHIGAGNPPLWAAPTPTKRIFLFKVF